jgi:hypothetical protein
METIDFFSVCRRMRGYRGDTFPRFYIRTNLDSLTGFSMRIVLENSHIPRSSAFAKVCTAHQFPDGAKGFCVELDSGDTMQIAAGTYTVHFIMSDGSKSYRKLVATLEMLDIPDETVEEET